MKRNLKRLLSFAIVLFFFVCLPTLVNAQPDPCGDPITNPCPIDSGLLLLIAAAAGYGIKKALDSRKVAALKIAENKEK